MFDDLTQNIKQIVVEAIRENGRVRNRDLARALGISAQAAHYHLRRLVDEGVLEPRGRGRSAHYVWASPERAASESAAAMADAQRSTRTARRPTATFTFRTAGLEEHRVWEALEREASAIRDSSDAGQRILSYAVTELVNNAIDHSGADVVHVRVSRVGDATEVEVEDEGVGAFARVREHLGLANDLEALAELSKGKQTTQPERHSGEGLFFVSKAVKHFVLESGKLRWTIDNERDDIAVGVLEPPHRGTRVRVVVPDAPAQSLREIFDAYTIDHEFARTRIVVSLFDHADRFVSRSEAKRLLEGLDRFAEIILDFRGVTEIGQGFADEIFRVWHRGHPGIRLMHRNAIEPVEFMIRRARATAR